MWVYRDSAIRERLKVARCGLEVHQVVNSSTYVFFHLIKTLDKISPAHGALSRPQTRTQTSQLLCGAIKAAVRYVACAQILANIHLEAFAPNKLRPF